jgi:uncharacterized membrane protein YphA (DoxX/SURF4 family)
MRNPLSSPAAMNFGLFLARVPLGLYFALSGFTKVKNGLAAYVAANLGTAQQYMPEGVARGYLNALPFAEIFVGGLLVLGLFTRIGAFMATLILACYVWAIGVNWMNGTTPFNNAIVPLGLSIALLTIGPGKLSADMMLFKPKGGGGGGGGGGEKKH